MALQRIARLTTPTKLVLRQLVGTDQGIWTGEMAQATDLSWDTADTVLKRLEGAGWVSSEREAPAESYSNRHGPRRFWQLTDEGREAAQEVLAVGRAIRPPSSDMGLD